ncbi:uncharacterized protein [Halyomorpha halys]|uniref:uncharacterized protein n=1 Tax=Halyomorpha halys TaxID=286706 RepID=UPI0006D50FE1|nr:uncharacterized protein LOC106678303 [Halyomorpha halys]
MKLLVTLLVLGALGCLQLASSSYLRDYKFFGHQHSHRHEQQVQHYHQPERFHHVRRNTWGRFSNSTYIWGQREECERVIETTRVSQSFLEISEFFSRKSTTCMSCGLVGKVTCDVTLPQPNLEFDCTITYIEVQSLCRVAGYACIIAGGIGHRFVSFHFESDFNSEMDFSVVIHGVCHDPPPIPGDC